MKHGNPTSPIFRNERDRWHKQVMSVLGQKTRLPPRIVERIVDRSMAQRPAHVLLMRPATERAEMLMELIVPAIRRAERKAGLR